MNEQIVIILIPYILIAVALGITIAIALWKRGGDDE